MNGRPVGAKRRRTWERWVQVLSTTEGIIKPEFDPRAAEARLQLEADRASGGRHTEYNFTDAIDLPRVPILHNESNKPCKAKRRGSSMASLIIKGSRQYYKTSPI